MTDPKRWSEADAGADAWEQALLRAELDARAPNGASAVVWSKLAAELGVAGALVGLAASPLGAAKGASSLATAQVGAAKALTTTAATWLAFSKGVAVGILLCAGAWSAWRLASTTEAAAPGGAPPPPPSAPVRAVAPVPRLPTADGAAPAAAVKSAQVAPRSVRSTKEEPVADSPPMAAAAPSSAAFEAPPHDRAASSLAEEARLLRRARDELRRGELEAAAVSLSEARSRHSASVLSQEREALEVELLFRQGQQPLATARARAFVEAYPESPHAARVRRFVNP